MSSGMIINLPIKDLDSSREFFTSVGFVVDEELTDNNALCLAVSPGVTVALLLNTHFSEATHGDVADTAKAHEVLLSIEKDLEQAVDSVVDSAIRMGAKEVHDPIRIKDLYGRSFADRDGHQWNIFCKL
jgi:predicted lactoylglutathione lyase